ncbi:hypothetical protein [Blastococcus sp. TF02A-30]|uniref:hypothetical protein n=1 Tax=Blastococcus sp. TF02A-30 TaxID=2250580 RepID=UPI0018F64713|nr:hypothetical protein [Blastococcus sp. TF02A-30]
MVANVAERVAALRPRPREQRWASLSACVLDAVWSIGARYDGVVAPLVRRVLEDGATGSLVTSDVPQEDVYPLDRFMDRFPDEEALLAVARNRQRTSTRSGITKAQAVLGYIRVLLEHGVCDLADANRALGTAPLLASIENGMRRVRGEGRYGIRRGYFWMLCGDDGRIKPDRMVLRWLAPLGVRDPEVAQQLLIDVAAFLSQNGASPVTPWEVDHAIWSAARAGATS